MKLIFFGSLFFCAFSLKSQFAPPANQVGTTAIFKDSSIFVSWATNCNVSQGLQDISVPVSGYANVGDSSCAIGMAGVNGVLSLGDGGFAILKFSSLIIDGAGPDFAVFENSFDDTFLELAFVEVSSNGIDFFRIPATSNSDTVTQTGSFGLTDATKINNLAGKYKGGFGTPFDLSEIPDHLLLNKQAVTHVKVIDVVGCIQNQYCTRDTYNHKINDPWPTAFGSCGFDLDAVGVINQQPVSVDELKKTLVKIYPNPVNDNLYVQDNPGESYTISINNIMGEVVYLSEKVSTNPIVPVSDLIPGIYLLNISKGNKNQQIKFIKL
ncbi:MAG: T9SS type A sorting domain-containing protein [Bacteroidota bacterium]